MKIIIKLLFVFSYTIPVSVFSQLVFTEIMYDPEGVDSQSGGEWVEVYNGTDSIVDLSKFKIADKATSGSFTNRTISFSSGSQNLSPSEYAVIAKDPEVFNLFFSFYEGPLFKSAFSLTDEDELRILDSNGSEVDVAIYTSDIGGKGDGNSIHKVEGVWTNGTPTPGSSFSGGTKGVGDEVEKEKVSTPDQASSHAGPSPITNASPTKTLSVYIGKDRMTSVDNPIHFQAQTNSSSDISSVTKYIWNMGDGTIKKSRNVIHSYKRKGIYVVVLNVHENDRQATSRVRVRVEDTDIAMEILPNGDIEIRNNHEQEINLYDWEIEAGRESFVFPIDTIVLGKTTFVLTPDISGIDNASETEVELFNPSGKMVASSGKKAVEDLAIPAPPSRPEVILFEILPPNFSISIPPPIPKRQDPVQGITQTTQNIESSIEPEGEVMGVESSISGESFEVVKPISIWKKVGIFFRGLFD